MYPDKPEMDFPCSCPVKERKNVWSDVTGVHVRFCPMCGERRESFYSPTMLWKETGRGEAGEPMPKHVADALRQGNAQRKAGVSVRNPLVP